jgi:hypothetical protein
VPKGALHDRDGIARVGGEPLLRAGVDIHLGLTPEHHELRAALGSGDPEQRRAGLDAGSSIFDVDIQEARRNLLLDPWIVRAFVEKKMPATVLVRLVERRPIALLSGDRALHLVGEDAAVIAPVRTADVPDLPVLTGFDLDRRRTALMSIIGRMPKGLKRVGRGFGPERPSLEAFYLELMAGSRQGAGAPPLTDAARTGGVSS